MILFLDLMIHLHQNLPYDLLFKPQTLRYLRQHYLMVVNYSQLFDYQCCYLGFISCLDYYCFHLVTTKLAIVSPPLDFILLTSYFLNFYFITVYLVKSLLLKIMLVDYQMVQPITNYLQERHLLLLHLNCYFVLFIAQNFP